MGRTIQTRDGMALVRRNWPSADARGTIVIVHGLGEHIGRYAHVAARLNASRWSVVGYDQRGHGQTEAPGGRYTFELLCDDVIALMDALSIPRAHWCGVSMGCATGQGWYFGKPTSAEDARQLLRHRNGDERKSAATAG